jgi:hypothetical protein
MFCCNNDIHFYAKHLSEKSNGKEHAFTTHLIALKTYQEVQYFVYAHRAAEME